MAGQSISDKVLEVYMAPIYEVRWTDGRKPRRGERVVDVGGTGNSL